MRTASSLAVEDRSVGPLYLTRYKLPKRWCRPFIGGAIQIVHPWRKGKALFLPSGPFRSTIGIGLWFRLPKRKYIEDLEDEQWLGGRGLDMVTTEDISTWSRGPDEAQEEGEVLVSQPFGPGDPSEGPRPQ